MPVEVMYLISRNGRSKGLRGIRSLRNYFRKLQLTAEQNLELTRCSRICNVGTIWHFMSSFLHLRYVYPHFHINYERFPMHSGLGPGHLVGKDFSFQVEKLLCNTLQYHNIR